MLDLQQGFTVPGHQSCSSGQVCQQANAQPDSEFEFWHARRRGHHGSFDISKLEAPLENEDCFDVYSPPMWKVFPRNQRYHGWCHSSEAQDTITGRRELMEMIQKMPESSYELSFSEMVDVEARKEAEDEGLNVETRLDFDSCRTRIISKGKKQEKRKLKLGQMSRSESMDAGNFLLKMFWPSCLTATETQTRDGRKLSKINPRSTSFRGVVRPNEWYTRKSSLAGESTCSSSRLTQQRNLMEDIRQLLDPLLRLGR